jgi:hypothetical protein
LTAPVPRSDPRSGTSGLVAVGYATTLPGNNLRIAAQPAGAIVTLVRRHCPPPVRALCFQPSQRRGNVLAERFTLFALGHYETCEATRGTEYRNGEECLEQLGHGPSIAGRLTQSYPKPDEFGALRPSHSTPRLPDGTQWQTGNI